MAKKDLKSALGAILDIAYIAGPLADAAAQMSGLTLVIGPAASVGPTELSEPVKQEPSVLPPTPSIEPSIKAVRPTIQPLGQPTSHYTNQLSNQLTNHQANHISNQSSSHTLHHLLGQPSTERDVYLPLSPGQGKVLLFLVEVCTGTTNVNLISAATKTPLGTVRDALRALMLHGYMVEKRRIVQYDFRGFAYSLNHQRCIEYAAKISDANQPSSQLLEQPLNHPLRQPSSQPLNQPITQPSISLSSSKKTLETTTKNDLGITLDHPELEWWVERGLKPETVAGWMEEFSIPNDQIIQALKHAAFDIPLQEEKRGEQIDPFNWLYAGLKRFGTYRRPVGYKPLEQLLLEEARAEREEREALARELAEERQKGEGATQELAFQQVMTNTGGAEYLQLKAQVTTPGGLPLSGRMLESAMREAFHSSQTCVQPGSNRQNP